MCLGLGGAVCVPRSTGMRGFLVQAAQVQATVLGLCENVAQPCPEQPPGEALKDSSGLAFPPIP